MREADRKQILPLLGVLKGLGAPQRVIVLAHLDNATRDKVYDCINQTLSHRSALPNEAKSCLRRKLWKHRGQLRCLRCRKVSKKVKRQKLIQMGGAPLGYLLKSMVPLMLKLYK